MATESKAAPDTDWVFTQFLYENALAELDTHFHFLDVDYMPIKGAYLICAGLARHIRSRTMADIDLLVREGDFDAVISHFSTVPGAEIAEKSWPRYKKGWPFEVSFYYPFQGRTINIDIHKLINLRQRFLLPPGELFARGEKQGHRTLPCAEDALLICLCHAFSHVTNIFPDALFSDIALLTTPSPDWGKFWRIARSTGIMAFIYYILRRYEKKRNVPAMQYPEKTLRCVYADFLLAVNRHVDLAAQLRMLRRAFIELPLCRDPVGLVLDKCVRSRRT